MGRDVDVVGKDGRADFGRIGRPLHILHIRKHEQRNDSRK